MSDKDDSHFDDPALKAALSGAFAGERAPAHLREKIANLMVESEPMPSTRGGGSKWRISIGDYSKGTLIAASVALLALMLAAYQVKEYLFPEKLQYGGGSGYAVTELPESFAMEMVRTHENCAKLPDHHRIEGDDPTKLKDALGAAVKVPVSAVTFNGWQFKGAGTCKVGEHLTAHLLYANAQGQSFSVFELPADAVYGAPHGAKYTQLVEGHAVSGLRHGSGLYCVVGSSGAQPLTTGQVEQLRDYLCSTLPEVSCDSLHPETVVRL
jgi:hypothetical protein